MKRILFFLCLSFGATAQLREVAEVSFVLPEQVGEDIDVLPVNDDIVLVNFQEDYAKREQRVVVLKYNAGLELTWTASAAVPRFYQPVSYVVSGQALYYLVKEKDGRKLQMLEFDLVNHRVTTSEFESITVFENIGFTVFNGYPIISGLYNLRPVVEMHNPREKTAKVLPDIYNKNNEVRGIFSNPYRKELYVFSSLRQNCQFQVATYDESGKFLYRQTVGDKKHRVRYADVKFGTGGEPFLVGTYNSACLDMVEGVFSVSLDFPKEIRYHSLATLPGYKSALSEKKKRRLQIRRERGKTSEIRQKAIFHVPASGVNGFLLVTEFYNAQPVSGSGGQYRSTYFAEHKIWRILITEIDTEGNVTYDRLYKVEGDNFRHLQPQSAFLLNNDEFYTFLPSGSRLVIGGPEGNEFFPLFAPGDGIRMTNTEARLFNTGPNTFIAHGVTEMRSFGSEVASPQLYFIKKFEFQ